jgi:L-glutamine-phosphate cytidylyltransferase
MKWDAGQQRDERSNVTAIILAAGSGRRLGPLTAHTPKCLLPIGGRSILSQMLGRVQQAGIRDALVVTGFEAEQVRRHVESIGLTRLRVRLLHNNRFADTNNLYSLHLALGHTNGAVTVLNGDDLFNVNILRRLLRDRSDAAATVDFTRPLAADAMQVMLEGGRIIALGKDLPAAAVVGNAIGLYRFRRRTADLLRSEIERWVVDGRVNAFYVAAINALASRLPLEAVSTAGLTWCEIDDARDLLLAHTKVAVIQSEERRYAIAREGRRLVHGRPSRLPRAALVTRPQSSRAATSS